MQRDKVLSVLGLVVSLAGCGGRPDPAPEARNAVEVWPPVPDFDVYVTWEEYTGRVSREDSERAVYVFDGERLGRGRAGYDRLLERVGRLPAGTAVLIYPEYEYVLFTSRAYHGPPWHAYSGEWLGDVAGRRGLRVVKSDRDHTGRLLPDAEQVLSRVRVARPRAGRGG